MAKKEIVDIAEKILAGELNPFEGCQEIVRNSWGLTDQERKDSDYVTFVAYESETDKYPLGKVRELWAKEALEQKDKEMKEYLQKVQPQIMDACEAIIKKFSDR